MTFVIISYYSFQLTHTQDEMKGCRSTELPVNFISVSEVGRAKFNRVFKQRCSLHLPHLHQYVIVYFSDFIPDFLIIVSGFCMFVLSLVKKHYRLQFYMVRLLKDSPRHADRNAVSLFKCVNKYCSKRFFPLSPVWLDSCDSADRGDSVSPHHP